MYKIENFRSKKNKEFYFRGIAENGKTVFSSEGYKNKLDRDKVADKITNAFDLYECAIDMEDEAESLESETKIMFMGCVYCDNDGDCFHNEFDGVSCMYTNQRKCPFAEFRE